jgi:hypothetical protein
MKRSLVTLIAAATLIGVPAAAHHSYSAFHLDLTVRIEGTLDAIEWTNPHTLLKVRTKAALYTIESPAATMFARRGVQRDTLKVGDWIVITGNPRRDLALSGVVNLRGIERPADGWSWPPAQQAF